MDNTIPEHQILSTFDISEVRLGEVDTAVAFAGGAPQSRSAYALKHNFSIIARFRSRIIGAALYFDAGLGRPNLEVRLDHNIPNEQLTNEQRDTLRQLASVLVDKALLKLHSAGVTRFAITAAGRTDPGQFWADTNWLAKHSANDAVTGFSSQDAIVKLFQEHDKAPDAEPPESESTKPDAVDTATADTTDQIQDEATSSPTDTPADTAQAADDEPASPATPSQPAEAATP